MRSRFKNKVVVITGAGSGIGRALAMEFAKEGAEIAINDRDKNSLTETAYLLSQCTQRISMHIADISDSGQVDEFSKTVIDQHKKVDILINNAGVSHARLDFNELSIEQWEKIMGINFGGNLLCTRAFLPHLHNGHSTHIVNLSSIFGFAAIGKRSAYCVSKFAITALTESLRQELADTNVNVSLVLPGEIQTNLTRNATGWKCSKARQAAIQVQSGGGTSAEEAARVILNGVFKKKYRILIGKEARVLDWITRMFPSSYGKIMNYIISRAEHKRNLNLEN